MIVDKDPSRNANVHIPDLGATVVTATHVGETM